MRINLKDKYKDEIVDSLIKEFDYKNLHQVPKILKIQINQGLGISATNTKLLERSVQEIRIITGLQPIITKAKKSVASFKIRENQPLGVTVTLRKKYMFSFLERLIHLVLPRTRDFRGLSTNHFDQFGNYSFGLTNQLVFPEIKYESILETRGFNITIVTSAKTKKEGIALLRNFGFPFKN
uniref:ribosomal protein L5 n=1 Tax=Haramonas pauciplastida TaxID=478668 RepID=UPI0021144F9C|nr:ribosomal protein L5 [Haramonas pauciplastida]UTE94969.1 ribosomal protein L5 [Haramonas pauciplastida]